MSIKWTREWGQTFECLSGIKWLKKVRQIKNNIKNILFHQHGRIVHKECRFDNWATILHRFWSVMEDKRRKCLRQVAMHQLTLLHLCSNSAIFLLNIVTSFCSARWSSWIGDDLRILSCGCVFKVWLLLHCYQEACWYPWRRRHQAGLEGFTVIPWHTCNTTSLNS